MPSRILSLDLTEPLAPILNADVVQKHLGRKFVPQKLAYAQELLQRAHVTDWPHLRDPTLQSFTWQELRDGFQLGGSSAAPRLDAFLSLYFDIEPATLTETKGYRLKPSVAALLNEVLEGNAGVPLHLPDGLVWGEDLGEVVIPLPVERIDATRELFADDMAKGQREQKRLQRYRHNLLTARKLVQSIQTVFPTATGGLPGVYRPQESGRFGPGSVAHLVSMPSGLRAALLQGTGWCDYDLKRAGLSSFCGIATLGLGLALPALSNYIANRSQVHSSWRISLGLSGVPQAYQEDALKKAVTSVVNGGRPDSSDASFRQELRACFLQADGTVDEARLDAVCGKFVHLFRTHPKAKALLSEIRSAIPAVLQFLESLTGDPGTNAFGWTRKDYAGATKGQKMAHHLLGVEAVAMRAVREAARWQAQREVEQSQEPAKVLVSIYDGLITSKALDLDAVHSHIRETTRAYLGVPLSLQLDCERF